ncbi:IgGFc-binding protein-like [Dendropsophus ebraccatus]|uniref:IgGFc-binding protein-like n=1 Tax=Dendropsophus ebraccatus TaxID=150705 RepID=UPI003831D3D5
MVRIMKLPEETMGRRLSIWLILMGICVTGQAQISFITAFMENPSVSPSTTFQLYLVTYDKEATVKVMVSQPQFMETVFIEKDSSALVTLNYTYMITEKQVTSKAILVESNVDISVFAFSTEPTSADAMSCLPLENLGTEYYISTSGSGTNKQFAVANSLKERVVVIVTVSGSITYNGVQYRKGQSFSVSLGYQQVIQFQSSEDLTATRISATAPVAVFSGQKCFAGVNTSCDTLVEQLYPVQYWGDLFAVFPLLDHTLDSINIVSANPDTVVTIGGQLQSKQYNLQEGSSTRFPLSEMVIINSSQPIMVTYLFQEAKPSLVASYDPFFTTVPPSLATRKFYKFITQNTYYNFLLIVSQAPSPEFYLDQHKLNVYNVSIKELNGFNAWEVSLGKSDGQHEIYHQSMPFTIYVYGIGSHVSYGYSMGQETIYPDAPSIPTPPENSPSQGILHCLSHGAEYHLPKHLLSEANLDVLDVHLEDPQCQAELDGDFVLIKIPFTGCGSNVLDEDDKTYYMNTIYGTIPGTSVHRIEIPVRCEMETKETLDFNFQPKVTDVVSLGHYNVSLKLYETENFTDLVTTYPHKVNLHDSLHVEFKVESDDANLQILVEKCKASPSLGESEQIYYLIQHGCSKDSTLQIHLVTDQRLQRFSFHVFRFDKFPEVYLSCNVIVCHNGTSPNRCTQGCLSSRHRRDARSLKELGSARLSQGPIRITASQPQNPHTVPLSALVVVIGVLGLVSVFGLVLQKYHYKRQEYTLLQNMSH